jgi:hypothetical protein
MTDRILAAAARRAADPDKVFGSVEAAIEMGGPAERAAAAQHFQSRADAAFRLYGLAAPPIFSNESLVNYRRRLLDSLKGYSPQLRNVKFATMTREALPPFEKIAIEGAVERFEKPEGPLRSCTRRDLTGREVTHWFGDEQAAWLPFTSQVLLDGTVLGSKVGRIAFELGTGANSAEAKAARAEESQMLALGRKHAAAQKSAGAFVD